MFLRHIVFLFVITCALKGQVNLEKGIEYYNNRQDGSIKSVAINTHINNAINIFEDAINNPSTEAEAALYLMKSYYFRGKYVHRDIDKKKEDFNNGKKLGEKYIDRFPNSSAFRFWYLVNLGSWSEIYGVIAAAREGVADLMRKHSKVIISIDPEYENGAGYFLLGVVHYKSPYIPFILSWPDNDKAISYISKAMTIGESIPNQKVYLAQALYKDGRKAESIKLLEEVADMQPSTKERVRDWEQIEEANRLLIDYK